MQRTVIGIKPDAFSPDAERERGSELQLALPQNPQIFIDEITSLLEQRNIQVISEHSKVCDEQLAREHYKEFADTYTEAFAENKQDFLVRYLGSGTSHWLLCEGEDAIKKGREVIGIIRKKYLATPQIARYNMTHGSGNIEEAKMEEILHFGNN